MNPILSNLTSKGAENNMVEQQHTWCEVCDTKIDFDKEKNFIERDETLTFKGETIVIKNAKIPICPLCHHEVYQEQMDTAIMQKAVQLWEEKTGRTFS